MGYNSLNMSEHETSFVDGVTGALVDDVNMSVDCGTLSRLIDDDSRKSKKKSSLKVKKCLTLKLY